MAKRTAMGCADVAALAAKMANVDVVAAYPITPQTHIVEAISQYVANGELDAEYLPVESEHSALSALAGASAAGARCFTATCGQGLALMHEILFIVAGLRLPIVMANTGRCLSPLLNIWGDQSDSMASRDCGWIQVFASNAQEIFDLILSAFKISEDERVLLPTMVNYEGFILTHVTEPVEIPEQEEVDRFLRSRKIPEYALHPDNPTTWGTVGWPSLQTEFKKQWEDALVNSKHVIEEVWEEFGRIFGRRYGFFEPYKTEDAEIVFLLMGGAAGSARIAVDRLRAKGIKAGIVKLTLFRPFPGKELAELMRGHKAIAVVERSFSVGGLGGALFGEVRAAFYDVEPKPKILGFVAGLGGRDISVDELESIALKTLDVLEGREKMDFTFTQVRR